MSLNHQQFGPFYHGTGHWFRPGEQVNPTDTLHTVEPRAYATSSKSGAAIYASMAAAKERSGDKSGQMSLFKPIYEVEPLGGQTRVKGGGIRHLPGVHTVSDAAGLRVKGVAGYATYDSSDVI